MRNDFCDDYLEHSAKGKTWGTHKYIAKAKAANGKMIYFYTLAEYNAYLKGKTSPLTKAATELNPKRAGLVSKENTITKSSSDGKSMAKKKIEENRAKLDKLKEERLKKKKAASESGTTSTDKETEKKKSKSVKSGLSKKSSSGGSSKKSSKSSGGSSGGSSKKTSGGSSGGSSKKSSDGSSKKSSDGSSKKSSSENSGRSSSKSSSKSKKETENKSTIPSLSAYKYKYELKDGDIDSYKGTSENERISSERVQEIFDDMVDKYPDDSSGWLLCNFTENITYQFKWIKEGGSIKLIDPDTDKEVASPTQNLFNAKSISLFRIDDKIKKP